MGSYGPDHEIPIIVRGEGCYVYDEHGKRYLDGLSGLFCVNAGHGRAELGEAAARQVSELDFYTLWSYAHPRAIELAARIASLAPGDLNRVFFTSGGSEAVESALKLARNFHRMRGNGQKHKVIAREIAYHGTSLGALSATGITELRSQFEPLTPGGCHVPNTNLYRWPEDRHPLWAATAIEERIQFEGPGDRRRGDPRAGPERRRLLRPARRLLRAGPRDLRPLRRADDLRRGDLRLGPARPLLRLRTLRLPARHHHGRQGADLGLRADGRADRLRPGRRAVHAGRRLLRPRLHLRRPPASPRRSRWPTSTSSSARTSAATCSPRRASSARCWRRCTTSRSSATCAAPATSRRSSWSRTRRPRRASTTRSPRTCCAASSPASSTSAGLICRADDRGDPVVQLAPPLIADTEQFEEIDDVLRDVLGRAAERARK